MFGVSTHLYIGHRLDRDHLVEIAAHGFDAVEIFAARTHFDVTDPGALVALAEWLDDTRLTLSSFHAPIAAGYVNGVWREPLSLAATDEVRRQRAVEDTQAVLAAATVVPYARLVLHAGAPAPYGTAADNGRSSFVRSLGELLPVAEQVGVALAVEVIPNTLSSASALVSLIEGEDEMQGVGICMDVGHARLLGDVVDAIEACSGHLVTTHLHDNRGDSDDHLVPGQGVIDWNAALVAFQKVGYDGPWIFEPSPSATARATLEQLAAVRDRFVGLLRIGDEMLGG